MSRDHAKTHSAHHDGDALSALLATENALREQLDTAATEAARIVADARARAQAAESDLASTVARAIAALDAAHERSLRDELASIAEQSRADTARFESVSEARIRELAARAAARVVGV